jgi:hypothetical protein
MKKMFLAILVMLSLTAVVFTSSAMAWETTIGRIPSGNSDVIFSLVQLEGVREIRAYSVGWVFDGKEWSRQVKQIGGAVFEIPPLKCEAWEHLKNISERGNFPEKPGYFQPLDERFFFCPSE